MAARWIEVVTGSLDQKKQYRQYRARVKALPAPYRATVEGIEHYLMYAGGISRGDVAVTMLDDLATLFEQSAADAAPLRSVVGDDPVGFVDDFVANYSDGHWLAKERARLVAAVDAAVAEESTP